MIETLRSDKRHLQVQQRLLGLIESGVFAPGQRLPSEVQLAAQLGISRPTLREALLHLERSGAVVRRHGVGTFVARGYGRRLEGGLERLESILQMALRQGMRVEMRGLEVREEAAAPDVASRLQLAPGASLLAVRRVMGVDGRPAAYLEDFLPPGVLATEDFEAGFAGSVLDRLRQKPALRLTHAVAEIVPVDADRALAERLQVRPGQALLLLEETLFDETEQPVEFSRNYFVPNYFRFHVVRR